MVVEPRFWIKKEADLLMWKYWTYIGSPENTPEICFLPPLTPKERELISMMLIESSNKFAMHSCNDCPPAWFESWSPEELDALDKNYHEWNGDPEEHKPGKPNIQNADFALMDYFASRIEHAESP